MKREDVNGWLDKYFKVFPPNNEYEKSLQIKRLNRIADTDEEKVKVIKQSIEKGWVGFYSIDC